MVGLLRNNEAVPLVMVRAGHVAQHMFHELHEAVRQSQPPLTALRPNNTMFTAYFHT